MAPSDFYGSFFLLLPPFCGHQIQAGVLQMNVQVPQKRGLVWLAPGPTPAHPLRTVHFAPQQKS